MPLMDWLAALVLITAWGLNFVVIKLGLSEIPPLLLGALRFVLVIFPAIFFIKCPPLPWRLIVAYGLTISLGQFVFLFTAMHVGMPAGLASVVLQSQAFFTVLLAAVFMKESVRWNNVLGVAVAVAGLVLIEQGAQSGDMPLLGFFLTLLAAFSWAMGNMVAKKAGKADVLGLVVWGALVPPLPFFVLSLVFEGPEAIRHSLAHVSPVGIFAVLYLSLAATIVGYVLWGRLLARHPASKVAPLSLLVPLVGLVSASVFLDERLGVIQWLGGGVVMLGLAVNIFGPRVTDGLIRRRRREAGGTLLR
ncbi:EamA family transporter [Parapusillimonas granuli]|uniref:EamA family transporter n=1 Tax=Parapusillimonas granuli TaxID=380911 RepID=A0A853FWS6_9BURK|nr:EamA family transporter [Parapusillimonas granuli]MBB5216562.1 O-acetylserine/cysteine efflux transporter [Parapusillimonas granuli]NYT48132.1 EamA family transporter [Parapusillimonas granuli]